MSYLKKTKKKQIHKTSKNGDIRYVTAKHPETASNLLKLIKKHIFNISTNKIKTVEKPNNFAIEFITIEH